MGMARVVVSGATGLVGSALVRALHARGDTVVVLARDPSRLALPHEVAFRWDGLREPPPGEALAGADALVHLLGEPIAGARWSPAVKQRILDSRVRSTGELVAALRSSAARPGALVCASATGFYGDRGDEELDEHSAPGDDFLARVCGAWEAEATAAEQLGVRRVSLRLGVVLARRGGALERMLPVFRLGLGGRLGHGRQYFPWIHLDDLVALLLRAVDDAAWSGPVNAVAPGAATNARFTAALAAALHRPAILPVPAAALRLALGEMSTALLGSQRAVPRRALAAGFAFRFPDLDSALRDALA
ncbi:MAG: TIGR01777 family protein [Deltaproteobacteria bacterium]|nr:TIGR01777 family protein [Deltaproteobacteria bacterium]